ncbi:phospholipase D-like domain-containing protein [Rhodobacter ferrooxidans]|uniref:Phospholipase D n=1 Tax=Rhodobacter ferrooxidans TaxID=371731 RepID=C8S0X0_9RHOB|nr:phosphatidylserine/phosphatidylglycerophosphate/cardiolipin synthase family protein [Rhodobacter sp. SW2]EEW25411.1 phospholipase D/Transphosphatidylase [Rhodobacter sp. SW2]
MRGPVAAMLAALALMGGCADPARTSANRLLNAQPTQGRVEAAYQAQLQAVVQGKPGAIAPLTAGSLAAAPGPRLFQQRWRRAAADVYLDATGPVAGAVFRFSGLQAADTAVTLHLNGPRALSLRGICDGPLQMRTADEERGVAAGRHFLLAMTNAAPDATRLLLPPQTDTCNLAIGPLGKPASYTLTLQREELADPALARLDQRYDLCTQPSPRGLDPLERAFFASGALSRSCTGPLGQADLLADPFDAFNAKIAALTGRRLTRAQIAAGNPEMPLDFSNAPKLDLIYLSYLHLRADFSGRLIFRALEYHAARGTPVRVLVTGHMTGGKSNTMLRELAARYPLVQIQRFEWTPPALPAPRDLLDRLHRGNHIKVFATLSARPGQSHFMASGRNLHDGFLFSTPRDLSAFPELYNYADRPKSVAAFFSAYDDLDIDLRSDATVRALMAQLSTFWHRDAATSVYRPFTLATEGPAPQTGMTHFLSVPYVDGRALERWYVALFDAARHSIDIVSPYMNLTPALAAAFRRAEARGVRVRFILPLNMDNDPLGKQKSDLNRLFVREFVAEAALYEHIHPTNILHSKIVMIDGRLTILGSVNFNQRAFLHDTENGVAVLDPAFNRRLQPLFNEYLTDSVRLRGPGEISFLVRFLSHSAFLRGLL